MKNTDEICMTAREFVQRYRVGAVVVATQYRTSIHTRKEDPSGFAAHIEEIVLGVGDCDGAVFKGVWHGVDLPVLSPTLSVYLFASKSKKKRTRRCNGCGRTGMAMIDDLRYCKDCLQKFIRFMEDRANA